jgi:hypothetical protein
VARHFKSCTTDKLVSIKSSEQLLEHGDKREKHMQYVILPLEGIIFGATTGVWRQEVELCISHCIDDDEFWQCVTVVGLDVGCVLLNMRRAVALFGIVVASMAV